MNRTIGRSCAMLVAFVALSAHMLEAAPAQSRAALTVVSAGPNGEIADIREANEIRVVFSEPMVTLGRIPSPVVAPFFRISPAVHGTFRWSGTTILIFTPDTKPGLPMSTRFEVTIDSTAQAVSGRRLAAPFTFTFTTPTVKLLRPSWYRRNGTVDQPVLLALRFNQPVKPQDVFAHLSARFQPHPWTTPSLSQEAWTRVMAIDPQASDKFNAKVAATNAVVVATGAVQLKLASDWDKKKYPASPNLVVVETVSQVPPESWVQVLLDPGLPSPAGSATPGTNQSYVLKAEKAFFIDGFDCSGQCDPDQSNPLHLRRPVKIADFAKATEIVDVTNPGREIPVKKTKGVKQRPEQIVEDEEDRDTSGWATIEDAGFAAQPPATRYAVTVSPGLRSADGQTLGYTWVGFVNNWHRSAFISFGDGHGVWETSGGAVLPFYARNFRDVKQWLQPIEPSKLMPTVQQLETNHFSEAPAGEGQTRKLGLTVDKVQSHGLDTSKALQKSGTGLLWAAIEEGQPIPDARTFRDDPTKPLMRATLVQVTNLGISVKDSPQNTLVFVTRLDNAAPVAGARVSIVRQDNSTFWSGTTDADGLAVAPRTALREALNWWGSSSKVQFIVTAEKDGDVAYVGSNWNEGIEPWYFHARVDLTESSALLRGSVFSDRGVYRLGEEVHLKAILRQNTAAGIGLLPAGTRVTIELWDSRYKKVEERSVTVGKWSSAEWTMTVPADGALGEYRVSAYLPEDKVKRPLPPGRREIGNEEEDEEVPYNKKVEGTFLVAAYRRPDFRVDVKVAPDDPVAGASIKGVISARYLFGAPMIGRPVAWSLTRSPVYSAPEVVYRDFQRERWEFVGWRDEEDEGRYAPEQLRRDEGTLSKTGELALDLKTKGDAAIPYAYALEGSVEDISRQHIANRAAVTAHPSPGYIGLLRPPYFLQQKDGLTTEVVLVSPQGKVIPGVDIELSLAQVQWKSVRRAEADAFYAWESERVVTPVGKWSVRSGDKAVPFKAPLASGGLFLLTAVAHDSQGRSSSTELSFYVLGEGYTAWRRYDHNRIDLVPESTVYRPGDTARIMIQSPWEQATALVTTEREGIRTYRRFALTSTQQTIEVPITEADIPNVYVSVLLVKGRTKAAIGKDEPGTTPTRQGPEVEDTSDPGKPSFRLGYVGLKVENRLKRLTVKVSANKSEYRPANTAKVSVEVKDVNGRGVAGETTLWAVDYGVLSLTNYHAPDVVSAVYVEKALQVFNEDNRERIISRRVLTPKGESPGGGGGADAGASAMRRDFRVLAFWLGSVTTDANGQATVEVKLPESLTTYRIMAVAGDLQSRFGSADTEVRINKPVTLKAAFPRFLAVGDKAFFGAVITNQLKSAGKATVTIKTLDPNLLMFNGALEQTIDVAAGGSAEVRFDAAGRAIGRARVQMTVRIGNETDAFEDSIPVEVLTSPETVAAYGQAGDEQPVATESLTIPSGVVPGFGGLHVELSSTAMVGLGEGARYLLDYPYGCAEQKGSRALALLLAADLGDAFKLPGVDASKIRPTVQGALKELEKFQCPSGGFAYWAGDCRSTSAYLTSYLLHVFHVASLLKYDVDGGMQTRAYNYLEQQLAARPPEVNEGWWPMYTAWQSFAVKVLAEGKRNVDSHLARLLGYRERMPVFALAYLLDALTEKGEMSGARSDDLKRRLANALLPEGGSAHVEELNDPYLLWFWNSNVRSTAIALNSFVKVGNTQAPIREIVRWLMAAREDGRWGNTQENAMAMEALVNYYRKYESVVPDFQAVAKLGPEEIARKPFKGRSTTAATTDIPMTQLLAKGKPGETRPLTFARDGAGTLFYATRLRYAADQLYQEGLDSGIRITRTYEPYVENQAASAPASTSFKAGDLVRVTLTLELTKERRYVAVTDPIPAGFEPIESWFASTASALARQSEELENPEEGGQPDRWFTWWEHGGFDHVERHDDRVLAFATRLSEGRHQFAYIVRATTAGTFRTAPAHAEEMYEPEVFGRTATTVVDVKR